MCKVVLDGSRRVGYSYVVRVQPAAAHADALLGCKALFEKKQTGKERWTTKPAALFQFVIIRSGLVGCICERQFRR